MTDCCDPEHIGIYPRDCIECVNRVNEFYSKKLVTESSFQYWKKNGGFLN